MKKVCEGKQKVTCMVYTDDLFEKAFDEKRMVYTDKNGNLKVSYLGGYKSAKMTNDGYSYDLKYYTGRAMSFLDMIDDAMQRQAGA